MYGVYAFTVALGRVHYDYYNVIKKQYHASLVRTSSCQGRNRFLEQGSVNCFCEKIWNNRKPRVRLRNLEVRVAENTDLFCTVFIIVQDRLIAPESDAFPLFTCHLRLVQITGEHCYFLSGYQF